MTAGPAESSTRERAAPGSVCPACRSVLDERLPGVVDAQSGETFTVHRCSRCGLGVTAAVPDDLTPYYGVRYYGNRHGFTNRYCAWRRLRLVESAVHSAPPRVLVDVGCGDGSFLLDARKAGWTVLGTEVNDRMAPPGLDILGSIDDLRARAPFGCITLWHSLEHLRDPMRALADLAGMLAPGGTLVVAVPDSRGWQARLFGRHWLHLDVPRHLHHFSGPSLRAALEQTGLVIVRVWHHELEYDLFGWIQSALNRVMPRPNILFDALTRRPRRVSRALVAANAVLAAAGLLPAFAATVVSTWARRGGTLIVAARRRP